MSRNIYLWSGISGWWSSETGRLPPIGGIFHNNISRGGTIYGEDIPRDVVDRLVTLAGILGINHAGVDAAVTDWGMFLLEFNLYFGTQGIPGGLLKSENKYTAI